ncbi:MAG TPA: hypothetical protein DCM40_28525 [Maribacter sp.]|nr:hypothetical protein [Maribacter sp.]
MNLNPEDKDRIFEEVRFVSSYTGSCDDWVTVKKEVMKGLPPRLRKNFSTRDPKTKEQSLNNFEKSIINYYKQISGIDLILRTLQERRDLNEI